MHRHLGEQERFLCAGDRGSRTPGKKPGPPHGGLDQGDGLARPHPFGGRSRLRRHELWQLEVLHAYLLSRPAADECHRAQQYLEGRDGDRAELAGASHSATANIVEGLDRIEAGVVIPSDL